MKIRKLLGGLILSTVLAAGVGFSIGLKNSENRIVQAASVSGGQNIFLKVDNSNWTSAGAAFALYCFNSETENSWAWFDSATSLSGSYRVATVPDGTWAKMIIVRMNPKGSDSTNNYLNWNNKWNQTGDITVSSNDTYTISGTDWDNPTCTSAVFSSKYAFNVSHSNETDGTWETTSTIPLFYKNDADGAQFYNTNVSLTTGMKFDVVRSTDSAWFHSDYLEDGGAVGTYFKKNGTTDASVLKGGTFEFYVKIKNNTVWTQVSSQTEADSYAQTFLSSIKCTNDSTAFAIDAWNKVGDATTSMEYKFGQLTSGAKHLLQNVIASQSESASNIEKCAARYDRILSKYGYGESGPYHDFMERKPAISGNSAILLNSIVNGSTGTMIAIISISAVSLAAVGGYFLFRKKKEN